MNCKPGDLAVVVKSWAGNEGRIVRVIRICQKTSKEQNIDSRGILTTPEPYWVIDQALPDFEGTLHKTFADSQLRPIRDPGDDAQDESLSWIPVPCTEKEAA